MPPAGRSPGTFRRPGGNGIAISRYLDSCGLRVEGPAQRAPNGWVRCNVVDRKTGEARGVRWARLLPGGGVESVKANPGG